MSLSDDQRAYLYGRENANASITSNPYTSVSDLNEYLMTAGNGTAKASITRTYKELLLEKHEQGDDEAANKIALKLLALEVYDSKGNRYYNGELIRKWLEDSEKAN